MENINHMKNSGKNGMKNDVGSKEKNSDGKAMKIDNESTSGTNQEKGKDKTSIAETPKVSPEVHEHLCSSECIKKFELIRSHNTFLLSEVDILD